MKRIPTWACREFQSHRWDGTCPTCIVRFREQGRRADVSCLPPRARFGRGWFSVGATHWFEGTDDTLFDSRDGKRHLAQTVCGVICHVTLAYAPRAGRECRKCVSVLGKLGYRVGTSHEGPSSQKANDEPGAMRGEIH
jgi:hypothetical protein